MSRPTLPQAYLRVPLLLAALAGCQDPTDPPVGMQPRSAQGRLTTWTVNSLADPGVGTCDETECTLREAIDAAASGDQIGFASGLQGTIDLEASDLFIRKDLTVDGDGRITVDAQGNSRAFFIGALSVAEPITVTLSGLTVKNGHQGGAGGIAIVFDATVSIRNSTISDNTSTGIAGGIAISSASSLTLVNSTVKGNTAEEEGGGIHNNGTLTVINSTIDGNTANAPGGGIFNDGPTLVVTASTLSGNGSAGDGGGLFVSRGEVTVGGTTISGNSAARGGGVANGNVLFGGPGAPPGGILTIRSSTITANSGTSFGGGIVNSGSLARTTVANTIVAGNTRDCSTVSSGLSSLGHNLVGTCPEIAAASDVLVQESQVFTEVLERDLEDNGGPTKTHALIARGRASDAGYCPGETADQRGFARPVDDLVMPNALDACDIGAYELQGPVAIVADLMISQTVEQDQRQAGRAAYLQHPGPEPRPRDRPNVVVTDILPSGATFVEARHNKGTHTAPPRGETGTVTWSVGEMLDQANEVAQITVTVLVKGKTTITNTASVTGDVSDPNAANNSASIRVSVAAGSKGGGRR